MPATQIQNGQLGNLRRWRLYVWEDWGRSLNYFWWIFQSYLTLEGIHIISYHVLHAVSLLSVAVQPIWYLLCIATLPAATLHATMPSHQMGLADRRCPRCPSRGRCRELIKVRTIRVSAMVVFSVDKNFMWGEIYDNSISWWEDDLESYIILYNLIYMYIH